MNAREMAEAFHKTELGSLVAAQANDAVIGLVSGGHIENTPEAKKNAYGEAMKMLLELFVAPSLSK